MAAEVPITEAGLDRLVRSTLSLPLNRAAAAALTVAFNIRKASTLSRGEQFSDDMIAEEIKKTYIEMLAVTDPEMSLKMARASKPKV